MFDHYLNVVTMDGALSYFSGHFFYFINQDAIWALNSCRVFLKKKHNFKFFLLVNVLSIESEFIL